MSACKRCGALFQWQKNPGGWIPVNADGSRHKCQANGNRPGNAIAGRRIVGRDYKPACGECDVPPWEVCACSALLEAVA